MKSVSTDRRINPFYDVEQMFEKFSNLGWLRPFHWDLPSIDRDFMSLERKIPTVDVIDRDDEIVVKAEMPGVEKKDIDVSLSNNYLTIKAESSHEDKEEREDYYRREISKGSYMRTVSLPGIVDESKVKATFKDGLLQLNIKKNGKSKKQTIKIE